MFARLTPWLRTTSLPLFVTLAAIVAGCDSADHAAPSSAVRLASIKPYSSDRPMRIVTTCGMVTDIVRQVAGDRAEVSGLMGEGVDPHLYKPTRSDTQKLLAADLVFYAGLSLEGRMSDALHSLAERGKPVFAVTDAIDADFLRQPPEFEGHPDPHVWMDVSAWSRCTAYVADVLAAFDPPHAHEYRARADAYRAQLADLDAYVRGAIASIPAEQRLLITAHDAFGYFARAYGIPVLAAQGISTVSEAAVDDINRLVDAITRSRTPAIFVESSVSSKNLAAVVEGAASRGHNVQIGGELYSDAMGPPGAYEGTYLGMLDHNATTIARALGGTVPERGLQGKLALGHVPSANTREAAARTAPAPDEPSGAIGGPVADLQQGPTSP